MALISKNIEKIKDTVALLNKENEQNNIILEKLQSELINDSNYQDFANDTEFGNQFNFKITQMLEISRDLCKENLWDLIDRYSKYVDNQENINNIEETM